MLEEYLNKIIDSLSVKIYKFLTDPKTLETIDNIDAKIEKSNIPFDSIFNFLARNMSFFLLSFLVLSVAFHFIIYKRYKSRLRINLILQGAILCAPSLIYAFSCAENNLLAIIPTAVIFIVLLIRDIEKAGFIKALFGLVLSPSVFMYAVTIMLLPVLISLMIGSTARDMRNAANNVP